MTKKKLISETQLAKMIRERVENKDKSNIIGLHIPIEENIITDGRIDDEYEDLPDFVPCRIDAVRVDVRTNRIAFHMHSAFTTHYPLMSNLWYNYIVATDAAKSKLIEYISSLPVVSTTSTFDLWKEAAGEYMRNRHYVMSGEYDAWFKHMVDCTICCMEYTSPNQAKETISEFAKQLTITDKIFIKMTYPNKEEFYDDMYLSMQTTTRHYILDMFVCMVMQPIWNEISDDFLKKLTHGSSPSRAYSKSTKKFKQKYINLLSTTEFVLEEYVPKGKYTNSDMGQIVQWRTIRRDLPYLMMECDKDGNFASFTPVYIKNIEYICSEPKKIYHSEYCKCPPTLSEIACNIDGCIDAHLKIDMVDARTNKPFHINEFAIMGSQPQIQDDDWNTLGGLFTITGVNYPTDLNGDLAKSEYALGIEAEAYKKLQEQYVKFENEYETKFRESQDKKHVHKRLTVDVDGITWALHNVENGKDNIFSLDQVAEVLPYGYRLPTTAELKKLIAKHPFKYDKKRSEKENMVIYTNDMGMRISFQRDWWSNSDTCVWVSDTLTDNPFCQHMMTYSTKAMAAPEDKQYFTVENINSACNVLLLIKETDNG